MSAIPGVRRKIQELVDGTLRVIIDIEPNHKREFLELLPEIDTPVAIAALNIRNPEPEQECGERCRWAIDFCKNEKLWDFLSNQGYIVDNEYTAGKAFKNWLGVNSRKELDSNDEKWEMVKKLNHRIRYVPEEEIMETHE